MVILLDGIDEAIKVAPWLPKSIKRFSEKYRTIQLIVSTRFSSTFIEQMPFFPITLMPFSSDQRDKFIEAWFKRQPDEKIVERIKERFRANEAISDIVSNPLLTTTLCVLAQHKLPLPRTEINLYNERIRLLTGYYDNVKNIQARVTISPSHLETMAQRLAFYLHSNNIREAELSDLYKEAKKTMINELNEVNLESQSTN